MSVDACCNETSFSKTRELFSHSCTFSTNTKKCVCVRYKRLSDVDCFLLPLKYTVSNVIVIFHLVVLILSTLSP